jgi:hypothetical protein
MCITVLTKVVLIAILTGVVLIAVLVLPVLVDLHILMLPIHSIHRFHNHESGGKRCETRRGWQQESPSVVVVRCRDPG